MRKKDIYFYNWVPQPLKFLIMLFMFFPILATNGAYSTNAGEMTAGLGILSEHIQFTNFATAIGMVVFAPFIKTFLFMRRPKMVFLIGYILLFLISWICAQTDSVVLLIFCSFLTGFVRITLIFNLLFLLMVILKGPDALEIFFLDPDDDHPIEGKMSDQERNLVLPFIYFFFVSLAQGGSALTAWLAHEYQWQYTYYYMMAMILFTIFLTIATMKYQKRKFLSKIRLKKFGDLVAASLLLLSFCFILVYGKTLDWFDHLAIRTAFAVMIVSLGLFVLLITHEKNPYLDSGIFGGRKVIIALSLFILLMILNSSSMFVSVFTGISIKADNLKTAYLSNYSVVGNIIGAILAHILVKKKVHYRFIFFIGFLFLTISAVYMYFQYQSQGLYSHMITATILRSTGMLILYAMCGAYGMLKLPMKYFGAWVFVMLTFRSVIGPAVGTALYNNAINERTLYYTNRLSQDVDQMNPEIAGTFNMTQMGSMLQGKSYEDALILASMSVKGQIQVQGTLAALKETTGCTIYGGIACMALTLIIPYKKRKRQIMKRDAVVIYPSLNP